MTYTGPVGRDRDDLAVARELDRARLLEERGGVRGEEGLAAADADHERHLVSRADEEVRMLAVDDDEREVTLELGEREPNRLDEIAVVVALDQVGDGLGVRLRSEGVAFGSEARAELAVVLDDPVEHDRDACGIAPGQRMRVLLGDRSVCRPARVPEPGGSCGAVRRSLDQVLERADRTHIREAIALEKSDSDRVVSRDIRDAPGPAGAKASIHEIRRIR